MVVHVAEPTAVESVPTQRGGMSAKFVEDSFLHPAMDGRVLNLRQYDPSPEIDSDCEWAVRHIETGRYELAIKSIRSIMQANHAEGEQLCRIAGAADDCAAVARHTTSSTPARSGRRLLLDLKPPLARLVKDPADVEAAAEVQAIIRSTPRAMLLSPTLHHQLAPRKSRELFRQLGEVDHGC